MTYRNLLLKERINEAMSTIDRELESTIPDDEIKENIDYMLQCRNNGDYNGLQIMCNQLMRHPILSDEQEKSLLRLIKNGKSSAEKLKARNRLLLHNQRLVFNFAKRYRYKGCLTIEDLIQEGTIG